MRPYRENDQFQFADSEIVIGLVFQLGVDRDKFMLELEKELNQLNYKDVRVVKLSDGMKFFENLTLTKEDGTLIQLDSSNKFAHINTHMDFGNALRKKSARGDLLALVAVDEIAEQREKGDNKDEPKVLWRVAHLLSSLKHPDEIHTLRNVYGPGFIVIGVHAARESRINFLTKEFAEERRVRDTATERQEYQKCKDDAEALIKRDEREPFTYGQRMEDAFQLADLFVSFSISEDIESVRYELKRFFRLLMGDVSSCKKDTDGISSTPTRDEYCMFEAYAASLRSGAISRQVGAAIATKNGEILALGCNEVPKAKGGLYWEDDSPDDREITRLEDSASKYELEMLNDVHKVLTEANPAISIPAVPELKKHLENTRIMKLVEFMREAHAEMDAISCAARIGISIKGSVLYCTTFPCHECAKLIVAAGIEKVVYIEPYRKSRALDLHSDSIEHDKLHPKDNTVHFEHFVGVGPSSYPMLFSLASPGRKLTRKDNQGKRVIFELANSQLRNPLSPNSYLHREMMVSDLLDELKTNLQNPQA